MAKIRDDEIDWLRKSKMIYPTDGLGLFDNATSGVPEGATTSGVSTLLVADAGMIGILMAAGEFFNFHHKLGNDVDPHWPIGLRVHYTGLHDDTGDATVSWIAQQKIIKEGIAFAAQSTVLDTVIALLDSYDDDSGVAVTTDWLYQVSGRGIINRLDLSREEIETGAFLSIELEMDAVANLTSVVLLALEVDYVPWKTSGFGNSLNASTTHGA